ncbi:hypothetical protein [Undibacterium sp. WLHG33]|uniref:hypothetical protein n=1 Tax=Undibacterium sp. WLHG33 TaxID=3412482 RepID=UPI003C2FD9C1
MSGIDKLPDLSDWLIVEVWTIEEAALLWAGINPLDAAGYDIGFGDAVNRCAANIRQRDKAKVLLRALKEAVSNGTLPFVKSYEMRDDYSNGAYEIEIGHPNTPDADLMITSRTRVQQAAVIKWAKTKNVLSYREEVRRADAIAKNKRFADSLNETPQKEIDATRLCLPPPPLLTENHPLAPAELLAATKVWETVVTDEALRSNGKTFKKNALRILNQDENYKAYSNEAKERIAVVVNPVKKGGAPKTP